MNPAKGHTAAFRCLICNAKSRSQCHFGAISCRACAAFFRRAIAENITYTCVGENNCNIGEGASRTSCRACRLRRCYENGMKREEAEKRIYASSTQIKSTFPFQLTQTPGSLTHKYKLMGKAFLLRKLITGYKEFVQEQNKVLEVSNILKWHTPSEAHISHIHRASYPLLYQMLISQITSANNPYSKLYVDMFESARSGIFMLHKCCVTIASFPAHDDTNFSISYGYAIKAETPTNWLDGSGNGEAFILQRYQLPLVEKSVTLCKKFRLLNAQQHDLLVLMMLCFLSEAEYMSTPIAEYMRIPTETLSAYKSELVREWHADMVARFGTMEAGMRLAQFVCLLADIHDIAAEIKDMISMTQVFKPGSKKSPVTLSSINSSHN